MGELQLPAATTGAVSVSAENAGVSTPAAGCRVDRRCEPRTLEDRRRAVGSLSWRSMPEPLAGSLLLNRAYQSADREMNGGVPRTMLFPIDVRLAHQGSPCRRIEHVWRHRFTPALAQKKGDVHLFLLCKQAPSCGLRVRRHNIAAALQRRQSNFAYGIELHDTW